jgi:hypothetical protein
MGSGKMAEEKHSALSCNSMHLKQNSRCMDAERSGWHGNIREINSKQYTVREEVKSTNIEL